MVVCYHRCDVSVQWMIVVHLSHVYVFLIMKFVVLLNWNEWVRYVDTVHVARQRSMSRNMIRLVVM